MLLVGGTDRRDVLPPRKNIHPRGQKKKKKNARTPNLGKRTTQKKRYWRGTRCGGGGKAQPFRRGETIGEGQKKGGRKGN